MVMDAYLGLFAVSFAAASLLPASSEAVLLGMAASGYEPVALWAWASAGNILGATLNYVLGRFLLRFEHRRWFPFKAHALRRPQHWFQRYGVWTLLFAWLPVVGDPLTFIAGVMRTRFAVFLVLTAIGKSARYAVLLGLVQGLDGVFS